MFSQSTGAVVIIIIMGTIIIIIGVTILIGDIVWSIGRRDGRPESDDVSTHKRETTIQVGKTMVVIINQNIRN